MRCHYAMPEPAEKGAVGAECCRSSTYQHSAPCPHHSGVATTSLEFKIACLVHQSLAPTAPMYLSADIHLASEHGRHLRSSSYRSLTVPRTRTTFGDRSFTVAGSRLWNSLPATLRQINSYGQFRRHLKTHLFRA